MTSSAGPADAARPESLFAQAVEMLGSGTPIPYFSGMADMCCVHSFRVFSQKEWGTVETKRKHKPITKRTNIPCIMILYFFIVLSKNKISRHKSKNIKLK